MPPETLVARPAVAARGGAPAAPKMSGRRDGARGGAIAARKSAEEGCRALMISDIHPRRLDEAVAKRVAALVGRIDARGEYMITGGVARNAGVVAAIGGQLGVTLIVSPQAQLCGALGAALLAAGR